MTRWDVPLCRSKCFEIILGVLMASIPVTERALLIRTDFSDDASWESACREAAEPSAIMKLGFDFIKMANAHLLQDDETDDDSEDSTENLTVEVLSETDFAGLETQELLQLLPDEYPHTYLFVFDKETASSAEKPILVVDLSHERGRSFRALPATVQDIDSNLSIANMDWRTSRVRSMTVESLEGFLGWMVSLCHSAKGQHYSGARG